MREELHNPGTDPELEARIVALVLGEASDFERDELHRLIDARPSLAAFKREIEEVHRLLADVATGESVPEDEDWKLPAAKRSEVLAAIDGAEEDQPAYRVVNKPLPEEPKLAHRNLFWAVTKIAAVLCLAVILGSLTFPAAFVGGGRSLPQSRPIGLAEHHATGSRDELRDQWSVAGEAPSRGTFLMFDGQTTTTAGDEYLWAQEPPADAGSNQERDSQSALSAIQDTLDINGVLTSPSSPPTGPPSRATVLLDADGVSPSHHSLLDDVYFSRGPEFGLSPDADTPSEPRGGEELNRTPAGRYNFGAGINSDAGVTDTITIDERNFSLDSDGDGDRLAGSQLSVPNTGNGDLSFPTFSFVPPESTVSVPDGGTVLLGGIKRLGESRNEHGVLGEPTVSSPKTPSDYGEPKLGQETQDAAGSRLAELGDRPALQRELENSPEPAAQGLGTEGAGQELSFSGGQARLRGGREFGSSNGLEDSQAGGENWDVGSRPVVQTCPEGTNLNAPAVISADRRYARVTPSPLFSGIGETTTFSFNDGEGGGGFGGGFGTNGTVSNAESDKAAAAEHKPEAVAKAEAGVWRKTAELGEPELALPRITGMSGGGGMGGGGRGSGTQDGFSYDASGLIHPDTGRPTTTQTSPSARPKPSIEDFKNKESLAVAGKGEKEAKKKSGGMPGDDNIAIQDGRGLEKSPSYSVPMPESGITTESVVQGDRRYLHVPVPMTGTAIGQPPGVLEAQQTEQDKHWRIEQDPKGDSGRGEQDRGKKRLLAYAAEDPQSDRLDSITRDYGVGEIELRAKDSLKKLADLSDLSEKTKPAGDLFADGNIEKDAGSWYFRPSEPADGRDESLGRRGQQATSGRDHWNGYVPPMLVDNSDSMKARVTRSPAPAGLNEKIAEEEAFSTFSLHVSDVSFKLARAALANGQWPEAAKVRIEEFVNAFDYGDPMPTQSERVSCRLEQSIHPFLQQRNLCRISMRTAAAGRASNTPLRLTFVLDNSGSMERIDRRQTVRRAFALLAEQLKPIDQVTLISFARQPRLLADKIGGAESHQLVELITDLPSQGGTNIEAALQLAFEKAKEQQVADAQNRIILLTDGAVNLGNADPESLSQMVTTMRDTGIAFDAAGVSAEGLNDEVLEALTRRGDGRYYLLDSLEAADDGFARQIAGALRPTAKNVKVQVEFNPQRVGRYKLLGFEKHRLKQEDFRDDTVDAAEMAAEEAGVALYQFEAKPDGEGDVGSVSVRFRDLSTGEMVENCWPIPYEAAAPRPEQAAPSLRIATSAAMLAARLRGDPLGETVHLQTLSDLIAGLPDRERSAERVQQLRQMIQQARQVSGE